MATDSFVTTSTSLHGVLYGTNLLPQSTLPDSSTGTPLVMRSPQSPSLDTDAHLCRLKLSQSNMKTRNYAFDKHQRHPQSHSCTRLSSTSTLYSNLQQRQTFVKYCDDVPHDLPSPIEPHPSGPPSHCQSTLVELDSSVWSSHKRRNTEPDLHTPTPWEQSPDSPVKRRRVRASSLDRGSAIYNAWIPDLFQGGAAVLLEKDIPETSPQDTASLWEIVRMPPKEEEVTGTRTSTRAATKKKASDTGQPIVNGTSERVSNPVTTSKKGRNQKTPTSNNESVPVKSQGGTSVANRTSPYNNNFDDQILVPRAIAINIEGLRVKASVHFGIEEPAEGKTRRQYYTEDRGAADSTVWVEGDSSSIAKIVGSYNRMKHRGMCETAFADYAKEKLFKRDETHWERRDNEDRSWRTERMSELVAKPQKGTQWQSPPLIEEPISADSLSAAEYSFDLRPDCSYWLSIQAFNPEYRSRVGDWLFVMYRELACPYFTIEFKKDNHRISCAHSQVASAASVALYNRYRLRKTRLEKQGLPWTKRLTKVLRHYGLTLQGDEYTVWLIQPILSQASNWAGCEMKPIGQGFCTDPYNVRDLIHWINEIHCWGLGSHGPRCAKDLKYILQALEKKTGFRPSAVAPDSEDGADSEGGQEEGVN